MVDDWSHLVTRRLTGDGLSVNGSPAKNVSSLQGGSQMTASRFVIAFTTALLGSSAMASADPAFWSEAGKPYARASPSTA